MPTPPIIPMTARVITPTRTGMQQQKVQLLLVVVVAMLISVLRLKFESDVTGVVKEFQRPALGRCEGLKKGL